MKIYTKTGDKGSTSLYDNIRVSKDDVRVESYGTVDELGSWLGLAKHYVENEEMFEELNYIQNKLFTVQTNLATKDHTKVEHHIEQEDIDYLESLVDKYMDEFTGFIVPGTSKASAHLHVARTVCRRAERRIVALQGEDYVNPLVVKYVNRLSDTIYAMARYSEANKVDVDYKK